MALPGIQRRIARALTALPGVICATDINPQGHTQASSRPARPAGRPATRPSPHSGTGSGFRRGSTATTRSRPVPRSRSTSRSPSPDRRVSHQTIGEADDGPRGPHLAFAGRTRGGAGDAVIERMSSLRLCGQRRRASGTSASETEAAMTTAASMGCGRLCSNQRNNISMRVITTAPTRPVTWVLDPDCSATAARPAGTYREALEEPGSQVGRTEPHHLAVALHLLALHLPVSEGGRRRDRVGECHQRDAKGTADERGQIRPLDPREGERGQALKQHTHQDDALGREREDRRGIQTMTPARARKNTATAAARHPRARPRHQRQHA
jgi:hypothetical protein